MAYRLYDIADCPFKKDQEVHFTFKLFKIVTGSKQSIEQYGQMCW